MAVEETVKFRFEADFSTLKRQLSKVGGVIQSAVNSAGKADLFAAVNQQAEASAKKQRTNAKAIIDGWIEGSKSNINAIKAQDKAYAQSVQKALKNEAIRQAQAQKFADMEIKAIAKLDAQKVLSAKRADALLQRSVNVAQFAQKQNLDILGRTVQKRDIEVAKIQRLIVELKRVGAEEHKIAQAQRHLATTAEQWKQKIQSAQSGKRTFGGFEGFSVLQEQLSNLGGSVGQRAAGGLGTLDSVVGALGTSGGLAAAGIGLTVAAVAALGAGAIAAANHASGFTYALADLENISGATKEQMQQLHDSAIAAAQATTFSPEETVDGLKKLSARGLNVKDAITALVPVMDLARVAGLDVATAADVAGSAMTVYGFKSSELEGVLSKLVLAQNLTAIEAQDLQFAISKSASGAIAAGQSFDTMLIAMGLARNSGLAMEEVSTSVGRAIQHMAKQGRDDLQKLHIPLDDGKGKFRDFIDILLDVDKATSKLSEPDKVEALTNIFGIFGAKSANAVLKQFHTGIQGVNGEILRGADAVEHLRKQFDAGDKTLQKFRENMQDTWKGQTDILKNQVSTAVTLLGEKIQEKLLPALKKANNMMKGAFELLNPTPRDKLLSINLQNIPKMTDSRGYKLIMPGEKREVQETAKSAEDLGKHLHKARKEAAALKVPELFSDDLKDALQAQAAVIKAIEEAAKKSAYWAEQVQRAKLGDEYVDLQKRLEEIKTSGLGAADAAFLNQKAWQDYFEKIGFGADAAKKSLANLQDTTKDTSEKIQQLAGFLAKAFGAVNRLFDAGPNANLDRMFSGLMDAVGSGAAMAFGASPEVGQAASQAAQGALNVVGFNPGDYVKAFEGLTDAQAQAQISTARQDADAQIAKLQEALSAGELTQDAFNEKTKEIEDSFIEASKKIQEQTVSAMLDKAIASIDIAVASLAEKTPLIIDGFMRGLDKAIDVLPEALGGLLNQMIAALPAMLTSIGELSVALTATLVDVLTSPELYAALPQITFALTEAMVRSAPELSMAFIKAMFLATPAIAIGLTEGMYRAAINMLDALKEGFASLADVFVAPIETVVNFVIDAVNRMVAIANKIPGVEIGDIEQINLTRHNGGLIDGVAHNGRMVMDEAVTKLRRGEGVLSPLGVQSMGGAQAVQAANAGQAPTAIGQPTIVQMIYNNRVLHEVLYDQLGLQGPLRSATRGSGTPGFKNIYAKAV